jgi:arylsulfatase A-like enzyme
VTAEPSAAPKSVLLVSIDTLRSDRMGALGNTRGLTPNLDAFAAESTVFTQAWSQANTTSMSHAALFTSRYPSELGVPGTTFTLGAGAPTLAEVLGLYGYEPVAFTAGAHLEPGWGLERGFTKFAATEPLGSFWHTLPAAEAWLDARTATTPFFLFVHGYDAHAPYLDPAPYGTAWTAAPGTDAVRQLVGTELVFGQTLFHEESMMSALAGLDRPRPWDAEGQAAVAAMAAAGSHGATPFGDTDAAYVRDVYDGGVAYADALFGWFMVGLRARGRLDDTIVVVLGDHGEALGEQGRFGHGDSLADEELHVPLYIRVPGAAPRRVDAPVALLDVMPTLLDLTGAEAPAGIHGRSLRPWIEGAEGPAHDVIFAESNLRAVSARGAAGRLSFSGLGAGSPFLQGLMATSLPTDAAWSIDTTVADPTAREDLRRALLAWRATIRLPGAAVAPVDPALREEMRKHGYFDR